MSTMLTKEELAGIREWAARNQISASVHCVDRLLAHIDGVGAGHRERTISRISTLNDARREIDRLTADLEAALATVERVRALHAYWYPEGTDRDTWPAQCEQCDTYQPCPTIDILDGAE